MVPARRLPCRRAWGCLLSVIPQEIPDFGSVQVAPRQNPQFTPGAGFTTEDYYVWSRLDGRTSLRDVILMVGLGTDRTVDILRKLRQMGAVLLPDEESVPIAQAPSAAPGQAAGKGGPVPDEAASAGLVDLGQLDDEEAAALAESCSLDEAEKRRIIHVMRLVRAGDFYAVLGCGQNADKRELKRAYFRMSKEFHPDRFYKQNLGAFAPWLTRIFETATMAFQTLNDDGKRAQYLGSIGGSSGPYRGWSDETGQTKNQHAAELFQRGCDAEIAGDPAGALKLMAAAVRIDPRPRYFRRAATCALACGELGDAEEYAKKAAGLRPDDASYARVLADVYRAAERYREAEAVLVKALKIPNATDLLSRELESDLAAVRAARKVK